MPRPRSGSTVRPPRPRIAAIAAITGTAVIALLVSGCAPDPGSAADAAGGAAPTFAAPVPTPNPTSKTANRLRVTTVGDSLMSGYGLDLGQAWPTLLANKEHITLTNLACGGMGFVVSGDCGTPYAGLVPALAALQPDVVIVQSSSNDFGEDPDDIRSETITTVQEMHDAAPDARIIGLSTIWNDDADLPDDVASTSDDLRIAVGMVDGVFLDVGQPLSGHADWMQADDVHPTPRGQQAIEHAVLTSLQGAGILP